MKEILEAIALLKPKVFIDCAYLSFEDAKRDIIDFGEFRFAKLNKTNKEWKFDNGSIIKFSVYDSNIHTRGVHRDYLYLSKDSIFTNEIYYQLRVRTRFGLIQSNE